MTPYIQQQLKKLCDNPNWYDDMLISWDKTMLTKGKFLVSFEVPGHTKEYTEGFTEEMVIPYRTEELNPYLRYPNQEINNNHLHSEHIRLQIREILQIITIIDIIPLP